MRVMHNADTHDVPPWARGDSRTVAMATGRKKDKEVCVEREEPPILYKRVILYTHFRAWPVWGGGGCRDADV